jgi:hypothetical protein
MKEKFFSRQVKTEKIYHHQISLIRNAYGSPAPRNERTLSTILKTHESIKLPDREDTQKRMRIKRYEYKKNTPIREEEGNKDFTK